MSPSRTLASALFLVTSSLVGCSGQGDAPTDDALTGALETTSAAGEREIACSFTSGGTAKRLTLAIAPEGRPTRGGLWMNQRVTNPPEARGYAADDEGFVRGTTRIAAGRLVVSLEAGFQGGSAEVPRRFELALPTELLNEPGRAATERGVSVPKPTWFEAEVVSSDVQMTRPRCEQSLAPVSPGSSGRAWLAGADAERLFDAMDVPLDATARPEHIAVRGERPIGIKTVSSKGFFTVSCSNRDDDVPGIVAADPGSGPRVTCTLSVMPIVVARADALRTYRATLTEREGAGRLFLAFAALHRGAGVGFETGPLTANIDRRDQPVPGSGARLDCTADDDVKTTCVLEVRAPGGR